MVYMVYINPIKYQMVKYYDKVVLLVKKIVNEFHEIKQIKIALDSKLNLKYPHNFIENLEDI